MRKNCTTCKHDRLKTPICDECYHTSDAPTKWVPATYYEPDTNAERIRAMSDEELADWLARTQIANVAEALEIAKIPYEQPDGIKDEVKKDCLEWLKQPAEEGADNGNQT